MEAILGAVQAAPGQKAALWSPWGEERRVLASATSLVSRVSGDLIFSSLAVCSSTSQLSHSRDGAGITLRGEKNPLHGDQRLLVEIPRVLEAGPKFRFKVL